jgi:hypothetical protein
MGSWSYVDLWRLGQDLRSGSLSVKVEAIAHFAQYRQCVSTRLRFSFIGYSLPKVGEMYASLSPRLPG